MQLARVNPVGLIEWPEGVQPGSRRAPRSTRVLAAILLGVFLSVVVVTTVVSLGAYCLTTDTQDVRRLPPGYLSPGQAAD